ncbi:MAG: hypothetical protein KJN60_00475 [Boseongicola sp.]|nr:hypothetical protein [Boseongicola sp.]
MQVKASDTRAALKRHVLPLLRGHGFEDGTPQKLWRHDGDRIAHIELSCLSTYEAKVRDATTASFLVRLGLSLPGYSATLDPFQRDYVKSGPNGPRPSEPQMPIRGMVCPAASPPLVRGRWGKEVQALWQVETPAECDAAAVDLAGQFADYVLDWLRRDWDFAELLHLLEGPDPSPILVLAQNGSHLWLDAELAGSPIRNAHIAMVESWLSGGARG